MVSSDAELIDAAGVQLPRGTRVTPMLRQWLEAKAKVKDAVLLFRMGDFYELFAEDAERAAPLLDLTITSRDRDRGDDALAMAGFPHHAAPQYIAKLVHAGLKVAVCEQLEDPALARGIVRRDITHVVTPGMVLDEESLEAAANNFLVAIWPGTSPRTGTRVYGLAALDVSTGTFCASLVHHEGSLIDEVARYAPREVVLPADEAEAEALALRLVALPGASRSPRVEQRVRPRRPERALESFGALDRYFDEEGHQVVRRAVELCVGYVQETQGALPSHVRPPRPYAVEAQLLLDATTRRHLDLVGPAGNLRAPGTLAGLIDVTRTALGGRALLRWLVAPSTDASLIAERHACVGAFLEEPGVRNAVREALRGVYDVERLTARVAAARAGPRELGRLRDSCARLPALRELLMACAPGPLAALGEGISPLDELVASLERALVDDPPQALGGGPVFRAGFDVELDTLSELASGGKAAIAQVEERERAATGIGSLKVKYTRVFGYYLEITKTHLAKVPPHYRRKQTVANAERFVTEELARLEEQVSSAEARRGEREGALFEALRTEVAAHAAALLRVAEQIARVDVLAAFAEVSEARHFVAPLMLPAEAACTHIEGGRHPVVEDALGRLGEPFIPSDVTLSGAERQLVLITGPNMAGKSTLMRQVALIQVLAQAGCFVPAARAELSVCDRIFTRVGASDDLAQGRSTFMVEMTETAHILCHATPRSLVLLDEIGRGTSTFDGLSIAWAVAEHLHDHVGARTLFATHYHELCDLAHALPRVRNVHVVVKEWNDQIIFTRTLAEGGAERSYGIQVARLAGLPPPVIYRARTVLAQLEGVPSSASLAEATHPGPQRARRITRPQMDLFAHLESRASAPVAYQEGPVAGSLAAQVSMNTEMTSLTHALAETDVHALTPIAALTALAGFVERARALGSEAKNTSGLDGRGRA